MIQAADTDGDGRIDFRGADLSRLFVMDFHVLWMDQIGLDLID